MNKYYQVRVITSSSDELHTDGLSKNEAESLCKDLQSTFVNYEYYVQESHDYKHPTERYYDDNAVDGWEDMFNY